MIHYSFFVAILVPIMIYMLGYKREDYFFEKTAWFFLIFISASRYNVGGDYSNYYILFNHIKDGELLFLNEPLYYLLNRLVIELDLHFNVILIVIDSFTYFVYFRFFKQFEYKGDAIMAFVLFLVLYEGFWSNLIYVRQEVAVAFLILAFQALIYESSYRKYFLFIFIGSMFHNMLLIFSLFFFLRKVSPKILFLILLIIFMLVQIVQLVITSIGLEHYLYYLVGDDVPSFGIGYGIKVITLGIGLYFYRDFTEDNFYKLFIIGQFIAIMNIILPILFRLESFFIPFHIYGLIMMLSRFEISSRRWLLIVVILYNLASFNKIILSKNDFYFWDYYKIIFFENDTLYNIKDKVRYRNSLEHQKRNI